MPTEKFFDESLEQSQVKARIVQKYFWAWAKVIMPKVRGGRIAYIDLFAGPGRYKDGTVSTPLLILERAIADNQMRKMLVAIFNDGDETNSRSLEDAIRKLPGIEQLKHPPQIQNREVGKEIVERFEKMTLIPSLIFVDPWGYKGLSLRLVNSVLKDWACECIFKHPLGYGIMKGIMAKESTSASQGVPSFMYNPADARFPLLFELSRPLDDLTKMLVSEFAGRTLIVDEVYRQHNIGRPFIQENYKEAIRSLEAAGKVSCDPPAEKRPKRKGQVTLADHVRVMFPRR